jgi:hypothetical protein
LFLIYKEIVNIINYNEFSNRRKSKWLNNGHRSLLESIIPNEVIQALRDWKDNCPDKNYVMIGGLALSYYNRPRYTEDIDLIFLSYEEIPNNVYKFRKNRKHSFEHIKTGVEVETLSPSSINKSENLFKCVFEDSIENDGIKIASPVSLIALKLDRFNNTDKSDIIFLYKYCIEHEIEIDLDKYNLSEKELRNYEELDKTLEINENKSMLDVHHLLNNNHYKINYLDYDIVVFESKYGEPRFYFSNDIKKRINKVDDFKFAISLSKTFDDDKKIRLVESSNSYNSFIKYFKKQESDISNFLTNENLNFLREKWNELNPSRKIFI